MFDEKIGNCDYCTKEKIEVKYSQRYKGFLCEKCWSYLAEEIYDRD